MIKNLLSGLAVILSLMYIVFFHINEVNPLMYFLNNDMTYSLVYGLSIVSIVNAFIILVSQHKKEVKAYKARLKKHPEYDPDEDI